MIIVTLMGGLGNQMFQYACGRHLALELNQSLVLNNAFLINNRNNPEVTPRDFELSVFKISEPVITFHEPFGLGSAFPYRVNKALDPLAKKFRKLARFTDATDPEELMRTRPSKLLLEGYFQSENYFGKHADAIRAAFTFKAPLTGKNKALADSIAGSTAISLHVRRGDYVSDQKTASYHGTCSPEYYHQAIKLIAERFSPLHFFVFSDDITWTRANIHIPGEVTYVDHNTGSESYRDMQLMCLCRHNIIANSSFSWWGAWLNNHAGKIVIAPAQWFNSADLNRQNKIIPAHWIKI